MAMTKAAAAMLAGKRLGKLSSELDRIDQLKREIEEKQAEVEALTERVMGPLIALGKTHNHNGTQFTAVTPQLTYYNEAAIRRDIGEDLWKQVQKVSLDKTKLLGLVSVGAVSAEQIAEHATVTPAKPYIKVTRSDNGKAQTQQGSQAA